jgi:hypothetical protein
MVREALQESGHRAQQFKNGMVDGVHYLELVEPIKHLKREGGLAEALLLCYKAIEAAERDRGGREPAPWYTETRPSSTGSLAKRMRRSRF